MNRLTLRILRAVFLISVFFGAGAGLPGAAGQSSPLSGTVTDQADGTPLGGVIVQLTAADGKVVGYSLTNREGRFSIRVQAIPGDSRLSFSCMGYRKHSIPPPADASPLNVALVPEPTPIREVTVKAPDILQKGDTLVYNVEKYADQQDRSIADVLKKMPGIEVSESGQIKYNGEPINKFYVEGSDLLEGRYGLASNNISHKDVKNVEVMENHQPVKALEGLEHSEQAAINLRLKEDAKLRWAGTVEGGGGFSPALWDASLFAMRIAGKWQSMENVKSNNTGQNPASESQRFTVDNILGLSAARDPLPDRVSVGSSSAPLDEKRTRFNRSVLANTTNSFKVGENYDIRANITYTGERLTSEKQTDTDYLDETIPPFTEQEDLLVHAHDLSALVALQANTPKFYLKNNLETDLGWKEADSRISGSSELRQKAETPGFRISNNLQWVRRTGNRTFTLSSFNRFVRKPHELTILDDAGVYRQEVRSAAFQSQTEGSSSRRFGRWQLRARAGFEFNRRSLESTLAGIEWAGYPPENDVSMNSTKAYVRPDLTYEYGKWRAALSVPANYYARRFEDKGSGENRKNDEINISPSVSARYTASAKLEISAGIRYGITPSDENRFYRGLILNNYRSLSSGLPLFENGRERSVSLTFRYRNPLESFFANAGITVAENKLIPLSGQVFTGDYILNIYLPLSGKNRVLSARGGISKGLSSGKILIGVDANYTVSESVSIRNGEEVPYRQKAFSIAPRAKGTIFRRIAAEYNLSFSHNRMEIGNNAQKSSYANLQQKLIVSFSPSKKWRIFGGAEHYYNRFSNDTSKNLVLMDAGTRWIFSNKVEIQLSAANLLNKQEYRYSSYGTLSETVRNYRIRPRNVLLSIYMRF